MSDIRSNAKQNTFFEVFLIRELTRIDEIFIDAFLCLRFVVTTNLFISSVLVLNIFSNLGQDLYDDPDFKKLLQRGTIELEGEELEISSNDIETEKRLGSGQYGHVYRQKLFPCILGARFHLSWVWLLDLSGTEHQIWSDMNVTIASPVVP